MNSIENNSHALIVLNNMKLICFGGLPTCLPVVCPCIYIVVVDCGNLFINPETGPAHAKHFAEGDFSNTKGILQILTVPISVLEIFFWLNYKNFYLQTCTLTPKMVIYFINDINGNNPICLESKILKLKASYFVKYSYPT